MSYRQKIREKLGNGGPVKLRAQELLQAVADAFDERGSDGVSALLKTQMESFERDFNAKLKLLEAKL